MAFSYLMRLSSISLKTQALFSEDLSLVVTHSPPCFPFIFQFNFITFLSLDGDQEGLRHDQFCSMFIHPLLLYSFVILQLYMKYFDCTCPPIFLSTSFYCYKTLCSSQQVSCVCEYVCDPLYLVRIICLSMGGRLFWSMVHLAVAMLLRKMTPHLPGIF